MSSRNRPLVNTAIGAGSTGANTMASLSNGFRVGMGTGTALLIDCLNFGRHRVTIHKHTVLRPVRLSSSGRLLRRIIMINCNARGGTSLANSMTVIGTRRVGGMSGSGVSAVLRNGMTNIRVASSNRPNTSPDMHVHNVNSFNDATPLCIVSNIPVNAAVHSFSPGSVRAVRVLGSTSTNTVCNSHTTGNIIVVAAGGNGGSRPLGIGCSNCFNISRVPNSMCSIVGTSRCDGCLNRTYSGSGAPLPNNCGVNRSNGCRFRSTAGAG